MEKKAKPTQAEIAKAIAKRKKDLERKALAKAIADELKGIKTKELEILAEGFSELIKEAKEVTRETKENRPKEIPKYPKEVKVSNLKDIAPVKDIKVTNPVKTVKVSNQTDIKPLRKDISDLTKVLNAVLTAQKKDNVKSNEYLLEVVEKALIKQDAELSSLLKPLRYLSDDPKRYISVRLSDGDKFYKAVATVGQTIQRVASGLGKTTELTSQPRSGASVNGTSSIVLSSNANRKYATFINTGTSGVIFLAFDEDAVVNEGIALYPNGGSYEIEYTTGNFHTLAVHAITSGGTINLAITEGE